MNGGLAWIARSRVLVSGKTEGNSKTEITLVGDLVFNFCHPITTAYLPQVSSPMPASGFCSKQVVARRMGMMVVMERQMSSRRVGDEPAAPLPPTFFFPNLTGWVGRQGGEWRGAGGQPADGRSGNREALGGAPIVNPHAGSVRHTHTL